MSKRMNQIKDAVLFDQPHTPREKQIMPCRNARCAAARPGSPCECRECRGALHNPPARKKRKARRSPRAAKRTRSATRCGGNCGGCRSCKAKAGTTRLNVSNIGDALKLTYQDARGQTWEHKFSRGTMVYRTRDGKQLIVAPVRVQEFVV